MKPGKAIIFALLAAGAPVYAQLPPMKLTTSPAPVTASPTTIGQLSDLARQKRIAEETAPIALPTIPAAPVAGVSSVPSGMTIVPSTAIISARESVSPGKPVSKKAKPSPPPEVAPSILAVARGANGVRYVELNDVGGAHKYAAGQVTPSGWIVQSIGAHFVELTKPAGKTSPVRHLTLSVSNQ